jgi:hypothetical protein
MRMFQNWRYGGGFVANLRRPWLVEVRHIFCGSCLDHATVMACHSFYSYFVLKDKNEHVVHRNGNVIIHLRILLLFCANQSIGTKKQLVPSSY